MLIAGVGAFFYFVPEQPKWSPWYCSQFYAYPYTAWGIKSDVCERMGCQAKIVGYEPLQRSNELPFQSGGPIYKCIKK